MAVGINMGRMCPWTKEEVVAMYNKVDTYAKMLTVRTAEHDGRLRKYYHITDEGLKRIDEFKSDWQEILSIYRFVTKEDDGNE